MKSMYFLSLALCIVLVFATEEKVEHGHGHSHSHKHPEDVDGEHDSTFDQEAILGSDADKLANLSPEESKLRLRVIAGKMDTNGDEKVSREELKNWIVKSFTSMDVDDAKKRLEDYDSDKDGELTWGEIMQNIYGYTEDDVKSLKDEQEEAGHDIVDMISDDEKKFKMADIDKNGKLDKYEYAGYEYPYNYAHMQGVEIERMLKEHDKNKDGKVLFEEFRSQDGENAEYDQEQFTTLDKDNNGHLDRDEIGKWASPDNDGSASDEADHILEHADMDKDGVLTMAEILENHEIFVGSQATDYGNYLHKHVDEL